MPTGMPEPTYPTSQLDVLRHEFGFVAFAECGTKSYGIARRALEEAARLRDELAARIAAESADAAAGSYAGRAEEAEAEAERLRAKIKDDAYTAMLRQRKAVLEVMEERDQARAERNAATARAEQAEAALARLRAQLGESGIEWGVQHPLYGTDYIQGADNARAQCYQLNADDTNRPWRVVTRLAGQWRGENEPDATRLERYDDATLRTVPERAADEQGEREGGGA